MLNNAMSMIGSGSRNKSESSFCTRTTLCSYQTTCLDGGQTIFSVIPMCQDRCGWCSNYTNTEWPRFALHRHALHYSSSQSCASPYSLRCWWHKNIVAIDIPVLCLWRPGFFLSNGISISIKRSAGGDSEIYYWFFLEILASRVSKLASSLNNIVSILL